MIRAGELRHIVTIERYVETQDTTGQAIKDWTPWPPRRRARVRNLSGNELFRAQERFATATAEITLRYFPGLDTTMRIRHKNTYYDILYIDNVEFHNVKYLVLCQTGLSDG